mgnify:CR=1 FL=1
MSPAYTPREMAALAAVPGICRAIDRTGTFMCSLDTEHDGDHDGFELPTIMIDEEFWDHANHH